MPKRLYYIEIFAVSLAVILLEIAYTRVFSFKVFYYFTYLIIGISLLGLGSGGVLVAISRRLREADPARVIFILCVCGGASVLIGYYVIALIQLNLPIKESLLFEIAKLTSVCLVLVVPFLLAGVIISTILSNRPEAANRLYGVDLLGAATGCVSVIPLLILMDPPRTIILAGLIFTLGAVRLAFRSKRLPWLVGIVCAALLAPLVYDRLLPDPVVAISKRYVEYKNGEMVRHSIWHPVFRVDVSVDPFTAGTSYMMHHDGLMGASINSYTKDVTRHLNFFEDATIGGKLPSTLPFAILPEKPKVLIIGSAGGREVQTALAYNAGHVTGVELNPATLWLLENDYAGFVGNLHKNPRVRLVNGEGRWFLENSRQKYDLIWFVSPDSYAAMNASSSGAFVLSESYLYTVEMIKTSFNRLTEEGVICSNFGEIDYERKPNRTLRYLTSARRALSEQGIKEFPKHLLIASGIGLAPASETTVLLSRNPLTDQQIDRFKEKGKEIHQGILRYTPHSSLKQSPIDTVIGSSQAELKTFYQSYPYIIEPVHDNSPFFWHFTRFRNLIDPPPEAQTHIFDMEDATGERTLLLLLSLVSIVAAVFLLLPFIAIRRIWTEIDGKAKTFVYFAALGLGFMFIEVTLIQMLTLFLGYPTYSLSVTLFSILVFSGIGSLLSSRYNQNPFRALIGLLGVLAVLLAFYLLGMPAVIKSFMAFPLAFRIFITASMIAPLGLCLGAFMPVGLKTIANLTSHKREYVAWAWAINGFFSVIASILSSILAMAFGFRMVLLIALVIYAVGVFAFVLLPRKVIRPA